MLIYNADCMDLLPKYANNSIHTVLTDIPYGEVNRATNGLMNYDKGKADEITFDLNEFIKQIFRITSNNGIIFCGKGQFSTIYNYLEAQKCTVRAIVWEKTNPAPFNGKYIYLSGVEFAVWFKKPKGTFNAYCKNTVFRYPIGSSKIHPTEKNHELLKALILDNTNEGDLVFDPCMGSGSTGLVALELGRQFEGIEIDKEWFDVASKRLNALKTKLDL